jgi:DNA-binding CsgD family transcriptional regulator
VISRLSHLQGKALQLLYQTEKAEAVLQAAFATALAQGVPSLQWRIAIDLGKLYHTQRRDGEAKRFFGIAQELLQELATSIPDHALQKQFLKQAIALLPRSYSSQTRAPARGTRNERDLLTKREREVVRLLSQGLTNQEIAASLVVSERTINSHLVRIFKKLGVNSRTAAATYAVRHGLIE